MGSGYSSVSSATEAINKAASEIVTSTSTSCGSSTSGSQSMHYGNITNSRLRAGQDLSMSMNLTCEITNETINNIKQLTADKIDKEVSSDVSAPIGGINISVADYKTKITNDINSTVNTKTVTNIMSELKGMQDIATGDITNSDVEFNQAAVISSVTKALVSNKTYNDAVQSLATALTEKNSTKVSGQGFNMTALYIILGIIIFIFLAGLVYKYGGSNSSNRNQPTYEPIQSDYRHEQYEPRNTEQYEPRNSEYIDDYQE